MSSYIPVDRRGMDKKLWNEIVRACAIVGDPFEIHCWADESAAVKAALQFGHKVTSTWRDGTVIQGRITKEFLSYLTESRKPEDGERRTILSNSTVDMTGGTLNVNGDLGRASGNGILIGNKIKAAEELGQFLWFELITTDLSGKENTYQLPLILNKVA